MNSLVILLNPVLSKVCFVLKMSNSSLFTLLIAAECSQFATGNNFELAGNTKVSTDSESGIRGAISTKKR